jgi:mRNA interferase MazF
MKRGDIVLHKFKEPDKRRPVLIITRDEAIQKLNAVTVIPTTTTIRNIESQVFIAEDDGMPEPCVLNLDWIQTVPKAKLEQKIAALSEERMDG